MGESKPQQLTKSLKIYIFCRKQNCCHGAVRFHQIYARVRGCRMASFFGSNIYSVYHLTLTLFPQLYGFSICWAFLIPRSFLMYLLSTNFWGGQSVLKPPLFCQIVCRGVQSATPPLQVSGLRDSKLCLKYKKSLDFKRFFLYQLYCWPMAPQVGLEPTTLRLTAACSAERYGSHLKLASHKSL